MKMKEIRAYCFKEREKCLREREKIKKNYEKLFRLYELDSQIEVYNTIIDMIDKKKEEKTANEM